MMPYSLASWGVKYLVRDESRSILSAGCPVFSDSVVRIVARA